MHCLYDDSKHRKVTPLYSRGQYLCPFHTFCMSMGYRKITGSTVAQLKNLIHLKVLTNTDIYQAFRTQNDTQNNAKYFNFANHDTFENPVTPQSCLFTTQYHIYVISQKINEMLMNIHLHPPWRLCHLRHLSVCLSVWQLVCLFVCF